MEATDRKFPCARRRPKTGDKYLDWPANSPIVGTLWRSPKRATPGDRVVPHAVQGHRVDQDRPRQPGRDIERGRKVIKGFQVLSFEERALRGIESKVKLRLPYKNETSREHVLDGIRKVWPK